MTYSWSSTYAPDFCLVLYLRPCPLPVLLPTPLTGLLPTSLTSIRPPNYAPDLYLVSYVPDLYWSPNPLNSSGHLPIPLTFIYLVFNRRL